MNEGYYRIQSSRPTLHNFTPHHFFMLWILYIIAITVLLTFMYAGLRGAPWVPTWKQDVIRAIRLAGIQPGQKVYDLGCGDGRIVHAAARVGAEAVGYDISLLPYVLAKIRGLLPAKPGKYRIMFRDFWNIDISDADVVFVFLLPEFHNRLKIKFEQELKPSAKVTALVWPIKGWEPTETDSAENRVNIYLYTMS